MNEAGKVVFIMASNSMKNKKPLYQRFSFLLWSHISTVLQWCGMFDIMKYN